MLLCAGDEGEGGEEDGLSDFIDEASQAPSADGSGRWAWHCTQLCAFIGGLLSGGLRVQAGAAAVQVAICTAQLRF